MRGVIFNYIRRIDSNNWGGTEEACIQTCKSLSSEYDTVIHSLSVFNSIKEEGVENVKIKRYSYFY